VGIAKNRFVGAKDLGFFVSDLSGDFMFKRAKFGCRAIAGSFIVSQFGCHLVIFEPLGIGIDEDFVDAVRSSDGDAGRDRNSLTHRSEV